MTSPTPEKLDELRNFEILFSQSEDLLCIAGTDGFFKKVNPAFTLLLGWDEATLLKTSYFELIHPDELEEVYVQLSKLLLGETIKNFVSRFKSKNGEYIHIQWNVQPNAESGNLIAIGRNVSALKIAEDKLKASEAHFRSFFENSLGLMCTHDIDGNFLTVNSSGANLLGYTPEELLGTNLISIIPPKHHGAFQQYLRQIRETGKSVGLMTTLHKNGSYRIWNYNNTLVTDSNGSEYVVANSIDVTESYQMERNLQRTKEMLLQTNQVARVGGWEVDTINNKVFWSEVTKDIHGVDQDYIPDLESALSFYKEGDSKNRIVSAFQGAVAGKGDYAVEVEMNTATGQSIWVRAIGNAEFEDGKCKRVYGTFQDIDERKRIELEVSNSRKMLENILDSASEVSIVATDTNGLITLFNKGAEKLLGYAAEEVVGKMNASKIHLIGEVEARSQELSREYGVPISGFRTFVYKAERESSEVREWTYITKSGAEIPVSMVVTVIRDHQNDIIGYLGVATDLSARRKVELELNEERARLMAFVEHAPAAVAMFDRNIRYLATSRRWMEDYRLTGKHILGLSHYEVFPNIGDDWKDIHQRGLRGEVIINEEEMWRPIGWETDQYLNWEVRPWYNFEGQVGGIMMFTRDVTESVRQREELRHARFQSEQASAAKSEFLANMSHEIRTPLNGIIGFTELVLKTGLNQTQSQYLNIVNQSANALLAVINDILDFSKIEAGKLELDVERCDIYEILSQSSDIISFPVQKKGLEMLLDIPSNLPRFIWVDGVRLKQVLINLLSNAAKFTEKGEIELKVEILEDLDEGSDEITCRFLVRDTGIGIRSEKQAKIFTAFAQEDGTTTKKYGGTGLGLTISNKLLGMMGSRLQISSIHGKGSIFYFDLTLKAEQGLPSVWDQPDAVKKVLVVDDNEHNRLILQKMLQFFSIDSDLAENGSKALSLVETNEYDAVLMDYHMPDMDGLETIGGIRQIAGAEHIPVVLLTSSADDATVNAASESLGIKHRVTKPLKLNDVSLSLSRLFGEEKLVPEEPVSIDTLPLLEKKNLILIVEDNPANMFLAKTIVHRIMPNAILLDAENGIEAIRVCEHRFPDLIFMDIQMPEKNGYDTARELRQLRGGSTIPIIALTAGNVKGEKERCIEAGMNDFISKPFVEESIRKVLGKYLAKSDIEIVEEEPKVSDVQRFDVEKVKDVYMNDETFISEFLKLIKQTLTDALVDLKRAFAKEDLKAIKASGHKLKGAASSAYLGEVTRIAQQFENSISFEHLKLLDLIDQLEKEIEFLTPILTQGI